MPRFHEMINLTGFGTELIYSFVIILSCLMIYFGTRELYKLSSHKGIKYFRESFLFFALAFFFRSFIKLILLIGNPKNMFINPQIFNLITTLLFVFFSTLAILYLIHSLTWKKLKFLNEPILLSISGLISVLVILSQNAITYFIINSVLFILIVLIIVFMKKKNNLKLIYILLSVFLFLNVLDILIPKFLQLFQILIYLSSIGIFFCILYKVLTRVGKN